MSEDAPFTFTCRARTRHPRDLDAYDTENHRYRHEYIHPESWHFELTVVQPPEDATSFQWVVSHDASTFSRTVVSDPAENQWGKVTVEVPAQGQYRISLTISREGGSQETTHRPFRLRDFLIVSIGDSYACGEGNPDEDGEPSAVLGTITCNLATFTKFLIEKTGISVPMSKKPVWQEPLVHRSYKSGPSRAAEALPNPEYGEVVTFVTFARSGAAVDNGLLVPREEDDWTELGEVDEARETLEGRPIDALIISVGGNDIHFPDRIMDLIRDDLPIVGAGHMMGDDALNRQQELREARRHLAELPDKIDRLAKAVADLNAATVYLTEYPVAHFDTFDEEGNAVASSGCGIFDGPDMDIDEKDAARIKETGHELNQRLRQAAQQHGWVFIEGIAADFAGHGLCSEERYFVDAQESCERQGNFEGALHPNEKGHGILGRHIATAVARHTMRRREKQPEQAAA